MKVKKAKRPRAWNSTLPASAPTLKRSAMKRGHTPIAKRGAGKTKRQQRNAEYYKSPEWRAKKRAVHERDGYRCTEMVMVSEIVPYDPYALLTGSFVKVSRQRCPNRGEVVNGKQTARGLVAEETSYFHRGVEGSIDTIRTRCKDCDRVRTPQERINHRYGFQR